MRYLALACDYDGTLALHGRVGESTLAALEKLRATGRKLLMVTGRELDDLMNNFKEVHFFDTIVAENGALLYHPGSREEKVLAEGPPPGFVAALRKRGVGPISVGRAIVATWKPHEVAVLEVIRDMGLDLQVIFNKDAVMVLPAGINKASGLTAALKELELSPHEVVGVGDAENDLAFLNMCECGVAVDNALPGVKQHADLVTRGDHGKGVEELIARLATNDLVDLEFRQSRHQLLLGKTSAGADVTLPPHGLSILIAGPSGSGKSTAATSLLDRFVDHRYQFCIIDPEGDYDGLEGALTLGSRQRGPTPEEILEALRHADTNLVVNLIGLPLADRPTYFLGLLPRLQEMRARLGRPHWLVVDEAHHLLPAAWEPGPKNFPEQIERMVFVTVHPDQVAPAVLGKVNTVLAIGAGPEKTFAEFCRPLKEKPPDLPSPSETRPGLVVLWQRDRSDGPMEVQLAPSRLEHRRHVRKYAEGELPPQKSFYFCGPEKKLNLRAQNLILFLQIGEGVDDATWIYHLQQGDYSRWFRDGIGDTELADEIEKIETQAPSTSEGRKLIRAAIERLYTLPESAPLPMPGTDAAPRRS